MKFLKKKNVITKNWIASGADKSDGMEKNSSGTSFFFYSLIREREHQNIYGGGSAKLK